MEKMCHEFLNIIAFSNTLGACMQRGNVYNKNIKSKDRMIFAKALYTELNELAKKYKTKVTHEEHCRNIEEFANKISKSHGDILYNKRLRIGTAQKAINVYLKFLWSLDQISMPPHCPIDGIVLKKLKNDTKWTMLDKIEVYKNIIAEIEKVKGTQSISEWECELWNNEA